MFDLLSLLLGVAACFAVIVMALAVLVLWAERQPYKPPGFMPEPD